MSRYALIANVGPSVVRYLIHGHFLKAKQHRCIVTMEHYIEVCTTDSIAHKRPWVGQLPLLRKARLWASFLSQW